SSPPSLRQHLPQHYNKVLLHLVNLRYRRLLRLTRPPPQPVPPLGPPPPLRLNRVLLIRRLLLGLRLVLLIIVQLVEVRLVEPKVGRIETRQYCVEARARLRRHLLPRLVVVPLLPRLLPRDELVHLGDHRLLVDDPHADGALEERVDVKLPVLGALAQELEDVLDPAH